jgi:hypothetical protein
MPLDLTHVSPLSTHTEYRIQLRRAWIATGAPDKPVHVELPFPLSEPENLPDRLERSFHRPPLLEREQVWLEFSEVPGLVSIRLNQVEARASQLDSDQGILRWRIDQNLLRHNRLELVIDTIQAKSSRAEQWGGVAIVIVTPGQDPSPRI